MIKHVRIRNFKSLGDVSVEMEPVTVLIGRSGTGKSNFVEAIRFLRDYLIRRGEAFGPGSDWSDVVPATAPESPMSFRITFDVDGVPGDYVYELSFKAISPSQQIRAEEKLSLDGKSLFHATMQQWIEKPRTVAVPPHQNLVLGNLTGVQEVTIAYLVLARGVGCHDFSTTLPELDAHARSIVMAHVQSGFRNGQPAADGLSDSGDNHVETLKAIVDNVRSLNLWRQINAALRGLNASVRNADLDSPKRERVIISHEFSGKILALNLEQESDGFRRFLYHLIAMYQVPPKQVLLFEHPENGIHPGALSLLSDEFKACPGQGRGQVILTTHSPQLLDEFPVEAIRVVDMENYQTLIGPVAADQFESVKEKLLSPGELLTVDQARIAASAATP